MLLYQRILYKQMWKVSYSTWPIWFPNVSFILFRNMHQNVVLHTVWCNIFCCGCRVNLKLITLGSERLNVSFIRFCSGICWFQLPVTLMKLLLLPNRIQTRLVFRLGWRRICKSSEVSCHGAFTGVTSRSQEKGGVALELPNQSFTGKLHNLLLRKMHQGLPIMWRYRSGHFDQKFETKHIARFPMTSIRLRRTRPRRIVVPGLGDVVDKVVFFSQKPGV